jgi:hypothetical protein
MKSDLVQTRIVITEKAVSFIRYRHPKDVPDYLWRKAFCDPDFNRTTHELICHYIAGKILEPMLGSKDWFVSPTVYNPENFMPMKVIRFNGMPWAAFQIEGLELIQDTVYCFEEDFTTLKEVVLKAWGRQRLL